MDWIALRPNAPVELVLAYNAGRMTNTGYVFSAVGGRALFLSLAAGAEVQQRLGQLGVKRGDRVRILLEVSYAGGRRVNRYQVCRAGGGTWGERGDGTFAVPCLGAVL